MYTSGFSVRYQVFRFLITLKFTHHGPSLHTTAVNNYAWSFYQISVTLQLGTCVHPRIRYLYISRRNDALMALCLIQDTLSTSYCFVPISARYLLLPSCTVSLILIITSWRLTHIYLPLHFCKLRPDILIIHPGPNSMTLVLSPWPSTSNFTPPPFCPLLPFLPCPEIMIMMRHSYSWSTYHSALMTHMHGMTPPQLTRKMWYFHTLGLSYPHHYLPQEMPKTCIWPYFIPMPPNFLPFLVVESD